jgi:hypothetical protein
MTNASVGSWRVQLPTRTALTILLPAGTLRAQPGAP